LANVVDRDLGLKAFIRQLEIARTVEVTVGIHSDKFSEGESIAFYGACNEYGTNKGIPSRPFMRSSFDENVNAISADMNTQAGLVADGKTTVRNGLATIGMKHQSRVKAKISSNMSPANKPATIARKKSSKTLIDTGAMRNSIHYIVQGKK